jgi:acetyltransferase
MQLEFDAPRRRGDGRLQLPRDSGEGVAADFCVAVRDSPLTGSEWSRMRVFLRLTHRDDLRRRFGHPFAIDDEATARRLFDVKAGSGEISWVTDAAGTIAGVAHRVMISPAEAEIAVLVRSDCQRRGIGELLIRALVRRAARQRLKTLYAVVQRDNRAVLQLAAKIGYRCRSSAALTVELAIDISQSRP